MPLDAQLRWLGLVGLLGLSGLAGAAGFLNTSQTFLTTAFCRSHGCDLIQQTDNAWLYRLDTGDAVLLSRASSSVSARIVAVALVVQHPDVRVLRADLATFQDLQQGALGRVVAGSGFARCYESMNDFQDLAVYGSGSEFRDVSCGRVRSDSGLDALFLTVSTLGNTSGFRTPVSAASAPVTTGTVGAPKFTEWHFTTCAGDSRVTAALVVGRASTCGFYIDIVPNGATAISAEFRYELDYIENGNKGKLTLDGVDRWSVGGGGNVQAQVTGNRLAFFLPLNVRLRATRRYTAINVIGTVVFNNGSSKRIYEPLIITQP